jgi:hypothetical protein
MSDDEEEEHNKHRCCPTHCCRLHGCKYGYDDCPVANGTVRQEYLCYNCGSDGLESFEELDALFELQGMNPELKKNALNLGYDALVNLNLTGTNKDARLMLKWLEQLKKDLERGTQHATWC